jgi:hypothetical protein
MRGIKRIRDLNRQIQQLIVLQTRCCDAMPEGLAFEEFHGNEWPSIVLIDIEDSADIRMIQG